MGKSTPVVINRRGFFSTMALGLFGTICVVVVCATSVTIYGVKTINDRVDGLIAASPDAITALAAWQEALPPAINDALNDERAPEYRNQVTVTATLVRDWDTDRQIPVIEVTNDGDQVVSMMSIRLSVEDSDSLPIQEFTVYAATPLAMDHDWRGPLLPGSKRRFRAGPLRTDPFDSLDIAWEVCDLRVWKPEVDAKTPSIANLTASLINETNEIDEIDEIDEDTDEDTDPFAMD